MVKWITVEVLYDGASIYHQNYSLSILSMSHEQSPTIHHFGSYDLFHTSVSAALGRIHQYIFLTHVVPHSILPPCF